MLRLTTRLALGFLHALGGAGGRALSSRTGICVMSRAPSRTGLAQWIPNLVRWR